MQDALGSYLTRIKKFRLLSNKEIYKLIAKAQKGSIKARNKAVKHNLRLVTHILKYYPNTTIDKLELVSEGNLGLFEAIRDFDLSKGHRFSTYAYFKIKRRITRYLENNASHIRVPVHIHQTLRQLYKRVSEGEELDYDEELKYANGNISVVSLNTKLDDSDTELIDYIGVVDPGIAVMCDRADIQHMMKCLTKQERDILTRRMEGELLRELGAKYHVCRERIRQIEQGALRKLQDRFI